jgi:hypothetical protein
MDDSATTSRQACHCRSETTLEAMLGSTSSEPKEDAECLV